MPLQLIMSFPFEERWERAFVAFRYLKNGAPPGNGAIPTTPTRDYLAIIVFHFIDGYVGTFPNSSKGKGWK